MHLLGKKWKNEGNKGKGFHAITFLLYFILEKKNNADALDGRRVFAFYTSLSLVPIPQNNLQHHFQVKPDPSFWNWLHGTRAITIFQVFPSCSLCSNCWLINQRYELLGTMCLGLMDKPLQWEKAQGAGDALMKLREECREWPQLLHITADLISTQRGLEGAACFW